MATRSGGGSGAIYALVIFVFLFVIALALAVVFYSQKTTATEQMVQYQNERETQIKTPELNGEVYNTVADRARSEGQSIFAQLIAERRTLKEWLNGTAGVTMEELDAKLKDMNIGAGDNALREVSEARAAAQTAEQALADLQAAQDARNAKLQKLEQDLASLRTSSQNTIKQLEARLNKEISDYAAAEAAGKRKREALIKKFEKDKADALAAVDAKEQEIRALNVELARNNARIQELVERFEAVRLTAPDDTLIADGEIIEVIPRDNMVYINLGRNDRLVLGMTFEVFDKDTGVQTEIERDGRIVQVGGKASIEVVRFSESGETAGCRIVRQSFGRPILEGDVISNIAYDKNRTYSFFVYGDFDLDGDNRATPNERQRVEQMIEQWGGKVLKTAEMPVDTDFLVLGAQMELPKPLPEEPAPTEAEVARYLEQMEAWKRYNTLGGLARQLSIPVLNQNRFLTLIGYYER